MKPETIRMGVIGVGHLGKEHARILSTMPEVKLVGVMDTNASQAGLIAEKCDCKVFTQLEALLPQVDAVSIVVPTQYHHDVSLLCIAAGKPTFIEKPLASSVEQARAIEKAATQANVTVQVGHIERFNPAYLALEGINIRPKYIEGHRLAPFAGRGLDVGVVLDLMIHDIDIVLSLVRSKVTTIDAIGASVLGVHEDLANVRMHFENGAVATLTASRIHPQAVRSMNLFAAEGYAGLDFANKRCHLIQPGAALRHQSLDVRRMHPSQVQTLKADFFHSQFEARNIAPHTGCDQLTAELMDFVHCVREGATPKVTLQDGLAAVELAEAIRQSIQGHRWEGGTGPQGATYLPIPMGPLFSPVEVPALKVA